MNRLIKAAAVFFLGYQVGVYLYKQKNLPVFIQIKQAIEPTETTAGGVLDVGYLKTDGFETEIVADIQEATLLTAETARDLIRILQAALPENQYFSILKAENNQLINI